MCIQHPNIAALLALTSIATGDITGATVGGMIGATGAVAGDTIGATDEVGSIGAAAGIDTLESICVGALVVGEPATTGDIVVVAGTAVTGSPSVGMYIGLAVGVDEG